MTDRDKIAEQAALWHLASASDNMDWDGFTRWLEADPRHRIAYDEVSVADALLEEHAPQLLFAEEEEEAHRAPARPSWRRWGGFALAASLVAVIAVPFALRDESAAYQTGARSQTIALRDGTQIELAPHSSLKVDGGQTHLALDGGAYFTVPHDPDRQLSIRAGSVEISDIGTVFDVQADADAVRVGVSSGQVRVSGARIARPLALDEGSTLTYDAKTGKAATGQVGTGEIGSWRSGRLTYDNAALALVAHDLERYAGARVAVPDNLGERRFSGTLAIGDGQAALIDLAQVMGLRLRRSGAGYRLEP